MEASAAEMFTANLKHAIKVNPARPLHLLRLKTPGRYPTKATSISYSKSVAPSVKARPITSLEGTNQPDMIYMATGNPVEADFIREGKLGRVFLDTNILECLLEHETHTQWLNKLLANSSEIATCGYAVVEYLASPVVVLDVEYKLAVDRLKEKGVTVIPGPFASSDSAAIASQVLRQSYQTLYTAAMKPENLKTRARKLANSNDDWRNIVKKSFQDLALVCEAHHQGFSFLSHDTKFGNQIGNTLNKMGITTYLIPKSWTKGEFGSRTGGQQ